MQSVPLTVGFEPLLGVQVALQHALIVEHVTHGLRDDDVHLLRDRHLLHLTRHHADLTRQLVMLHQHLSKDKGTQYRLSQLMTYFNNIRDTY